MSVVPSNPDLTMGDELLKKTGTDSFRVNDSTFAT